jgi:hypothetical protein
MAFADPQLTVRPELAAEGLEPQLLHGPTVQPVDGFSYRVEVWELVDGGRVIVVRGLVDAPSVGNKSAAIAAVVYSAWGEQTVIIEDWGQSGQAGERFTISSGDGGSGEVDYDALRARGVILSEDRFQEP